MRERPILFNDEMVRAILEGRKTQTRRIVKPQPDFVTDEGLPARFTPSDAELGRLGTLISCPHGQPGDRLWVRETFLPDPPIDGSEPWDDNALSDHEWSGCGGPLHAVPEAFRGPEYCIYRATWNASDGWKWRPSIHMPRWASRITLEITDVRVERLQDISEADAKAEGARFELAEVDSVRLGAEASHKSGFQNLWQSINGPDSWHANPWVWVIEFRRIDQENKQ